MSDEELIATLDDWLSNSVFRNTQKKRLVRELIKRYSDKKLSDFRKLLVNDLPEGMKVLIMTEKDFCRLYESDYISKDKIIEKIKKLERVKEEYLKRHQFIDLDRILYKIEVLKELLGE